MTETATETLTPEVIIEQSNAPLVPHDAATQLFAVAEDMGSRIAQYREAAEGLVIATEEDAVKTNELLATMRQDVKTITEAVADFKKAAHERHKLWTKFEDLFKSPLEEIGKAIKRQLQDWQMEQNRKAEEERKRLQAEADERARKERERLAKEAAKLKTPEKKAERLEQAASVQAPTIEVAAPKSGVRLSKYWVANVTDPSAFFSAIAQRPDLAGYAEISTTKLARAKSANPMIDIPGITFTQEIR